MWGKLASCLCWLPSVCGMQNILCPSQVLSVSLTNVLHSIVKFLCRYFLNVCCSFKWDPLFHFRKASEGFACWSSVFPNGIWSSSYLLPWGVPFTQLSPQIISVLLISFSGVIFKMTDRLGCGSNARTLVPHAWWRLWLQSLKPPRRKGCVGSHPVIPSWFDKNVSSLQCEAFWHETGFLLSWDSFIIDILGCFFGHWIAPGFIEWSFCIWLLFSSFSLDLTMCFLCWTIFAFQCSASYRLRNILYKQVGFNFMLSRMFPFILKCKIGL